MKAEFLKYFREIGIREPILDRIQTLSDHIKTLIPDADFPDVVVNEIVDKSGNRIYQTLRFVSEDLGVTVINFVDKPEITINRPRNLPSVVFEAKDFDFKKANENSRVTILASYPFSNEKYVYLRGSGVNCDHIMYIYRKYIFPRLKKF
jgi:hypothetical protein